MLGNIITLALSYFLGRANHVHDKDGGFLSNLTLAAVKRALAEFTLYMVCLSVFFFGAVIITADLIITTKQGSGVALSDLSWVGLGVMLIAVVGAVSTAMVGFRGENLIWQTKKQTQHSANAIGDAVTLLVMDFLEERKAKRSMAEDEKRAYAANKRHASQNHVL